MFVDNDPHVRGSLKAFFVNGPAEYLFFQSGADGLNSLKNNPADIVVSDYFLPDMDGISFLKRVGQIHGSTVRILMATLGDDSLVEESRQSGIERFIEKPINADTLDRMLKEFDLKFTN
ncbi:MAG: response regulator [Desulfobacterales bacterium]|nr:response regulator [Desulfobacterales bacterium]